MKIDWKRKLSSRKFWALIAGFVAGIIVFVKSPERSPEAVGGLVVMLGSIVSYVIGEGLADSKRDITETASPDCGDACTITYSDEEE